MSIFYTLRRLFMPLPFPPRLLWTSKHGTQVFRTSPNTIEFTTGANIDGDGSPFCYSPQPGKGLDALANAGHPGNWFGVVTDTGKPDGNPVVQGPNDPAPGFYVSQTALENPKYARTDPRRYLDASTARFIVMPGKFPVHVLGEACKVEWNGKEATGIVGDIGPSDEIGEISIAMAEALGMPSSPRDGGVSHGVHYTVYA